MTREKGVILKDQALKLSAISQYMKWNKDIHWSQEIGITNTTISNWRRGTPISFQLIRKIVVKINDASNDGKITEEFMSLSGIQEFCKKLGIESKNIDAEVELFSNRRVTDFDIELMREMRGRYHAIYLARELVTRKRHLDCEPIQFGSYIEDRKVVNAWQESNKITNSKAQGYARVINERVVCVLQWEQLFPESVYHLIPIKLRDGRYAFYGIYLDVNEPPAREIFAARVLIVPFVDGIGEERRVNEPHPIFNCLEKLLEDKSIYNNRERFVVSNTQETWDLIREALKEIYAGAV